MSNPWAQSFDDLRSPYLQEKKAKKDYDGDGKVESGAKEYRGVVHNKIQKAKGGKADGQDTSSVKESKSMKSFLNKKAKKLEGDKKKQSAPYKNNPAFGDPSHHSNKKNRMEHHQKDADGNVLEHDETTPSSVEEGKKGLWDNIHAKRKRGEKPAKKGDKDYPKTLNVEGKMKQARKNVGADTCWDGYKAKGTKMKGGKSVPNCVKVEGKSYSISMKSFGDMIKEDLEEALKGKKLDIKETGVKNKIQINPEVKSEEAKAPVKK